MVSEDQKEFLGKVKPLARQLLDFAMTEGKAYGITDAKVAISVSDTQKDGVEKGEVAEIVSGTSWSVAVALYAGARKMSFSKNTLDADKLIEAMKDNMQVIHLVPENPNGLLLEAEKVSAQPDDENLELYEDNQADQAQMIDYARRMEAATSAVSGIKTADHVKMTRKSGQSYVIATNGLEMHNAATSYSAQSSGIAVGADGLMEADSDYSMAHHFSDMTDPEELGRQAGENAVAKLNSIQPDTGEMPIVLDHAAGEQFFSDTVYGALDASAVFSGDSFFKGQVGAPVMSEGVTLVDDPSVVRGLGSGTIDTAGIEMKKVTFIENGVLKAFNASVMDARQLGIEPTGREGVGITNSTVLPGSQTPDELVADIKEGIYIKGFNGGTINTANGTHSREAYGLLIKDGHVTKQAVSGFVVSGNLKKMFKNVTLANDTPRLPNTRYNIAVPTMRIDGCTIAGK